MNHMKSTGILSIKDLGNVRNASTTHRDGVLRAVVRRGGGRHTTKNYPSAWDCFLPTESRVTELPFKLQGCVPFRGPRCEGREGVGE